MFGEQRAVRYFLRCEELEQGGFDVEVRDSPPTTDPRSGTLLWVPPLIILWVGERPLAVRVRSIIALNSYAPTSRIASYLEREANAYGLPVEHVCEAGLWRLFERPPRLREAL
jgi:hypothetical protein